MPKKHWKRQKNFCFSLTFPPLGSIFGLNSESISKFVLISFFGAVSKEYRASYSSSKFALDGMTLALAAEVSKKGILANSVGPGFIDTDMTRNVLGESGISELKGQIPIGRLGHTNEIASLVSWLVSIENTYMTGQNLMIDGGFSRV